MYPKYGASQEILGLSEISFVAKLCSLLTTRTPRNSRIHTFTHPHIHAFTHPHFTFTHSYTSNTYIKDTKTEQSEGNNGAQVLKNEESRIPAFHIGIASLHEDEDGEYDNKHSHEGQQHQCIH